MVGRYLEDVSRVGVHVLFDKSLTPQPLAKAELVGGIFKFTIQVLVRRGQEADGMGMNQSSSKRDVHDTCIVKIVL